MKADFFIAEIGSTTTVVSAVNKIKEGGAVLLGQGQAPTTVHSEEGVTEGLNNAVKDLRASLGAACISCSEMLATSSAAGGLRMTVHGLVRDMTLRSAREAALGAGANLHMCSAGVLTKFDLEEIEEINPNLILLAGGTDYGERETTLTNAELLCGLSIRPPVIYAGNVANQRRIGSILRASGFNCHIVDNVYPGLDELNVEPARKVIHQVFEENITKAPGMQNVRSMVSGAILPTPGAVMEGAQLLYRHIGDLLVIDVGGATTDIHSVTEGSDEISALMINPEPMAKRTVEGDLGVYVNAKNLAAQVGEQELNRETGLDVSLVLQNYKPIPENEEQLKLAQALSRHAASIALKRHAGRLNYTYGASGRKAYAQGKDLTGVKWLIGTGGALSRMPGHREILEELCGLGANELLLLPKPAAVKALADKDYIMAAAGVLSKKYPEAALALLEKSLGIGDL